MTNQQLLTALLKTTQAGQVEIRSVLDTVMGAGLRGTLQSQLREYDAMETEALTIALQRGWDLRSLEPGKRFLTDAVTRLQLNGRNTDSRIAEIMIRKNMTAMIDSRKNLNRNQCPDSLVRILSQKVLDCANAHIHQLQFYL